MKCMQMIINIYYRSCDTFYLCVGSVDMVHFFVLVKTPTVFFFSTTNTARLLCASGPIVSLLAREHLTLLPTKYEVASLV